MPYSVHIEQTSRDGVPGMQRLLHQAISELEAVGIVRAAVAHARLAQQRVTFSVYAPDARLILSYTGADRE